MQLQKTNVEGLYKDPFTGAIINRKENELMQYRSQVTYHKEMQHIQSEVNTLKSDLTDIKSMLMKILDKNS